MWLCVNILTQGDDSGLTVVMYVVITCSKAHQPRLLVLYCGRTSLSCFYFLSLEGGRKKERKHARARTQTRTQAEEEKCCKTKTPSGTRVKEGALHQGRWEARMRNGDGRRYHEAALNINKNRARLAACFGLKSLQPRLNQSIPFYSVKRSVFFLAVFRRRGHESLKALQWLHFVSLFSELGERYSEEWIWGKFIKESQEWSWACYINSLYVFKSTTKCT